VYGLPTRLSVLVPSAPFGCALVVIAAELGSSDRFDPVVAWGGCALALLVVARQILALLENIAFWRDLEAEVAASNAELRRREARFRSLVHNSSDVITVVNLDGTIEYQSPSVERVLGRSVAQVEAEGLAALVHADDLTRVAAAIGDVGIRPDLVRRLDCRVTSVDGQDRYAEMVIANLLDDPDISAVVLTMHDVTERRLLEERLSHMAFHDSLTGLVNRGVLADRLGQALVRSRRFGASLAVALLDLDDFKAVNDSLGHITGDALLIAVAARLREAVGDGSTVARLGGDEFAVLIEEIDAGDALHTATEALLGVFDEPFDVGDERFVVRASIGVAVGDGGRVTAEDLLRHADIAMYGAKANGKGGARRYEDGVDREIVDRMLLEVDLRLALARDELFLEYQPQVDLVTRATVGFEALVRWQHPTRGLVSPLEFIPIAERSGMILELGAWVLRTACLQAGRWQRDLRPSPPLEMSVNLSVRQLRTTDLAERVTAALEESGLEPSSLMLEVTESVVMDELATEALQHLHALGVRIALDDFGTGYSCLAYLRQLPVDALKIDRSFMPGAGEDAAETVLSEAVVSLANAMGLDTVAEGVETEAQRRLLLAMGARLGQGYLFGRPASAEDSEARLRAEQAARSAARAADQIDWRPPTVTRPPSRTLR
jgi:diguanylate cyclase (GGDEF)-like protein/PAS domain S-box-containing protein